jgi:hypothetical protein
MSVLLVSCGSTKSEYEYLLQKAAVIVIEVDGQIVDVQLLDEIPGEKFIIDKGSDVTVTIFGVSVKSNPRGITASGAKVFIYPEDGIIARAASESLQFGVKIDNILLSRVHDYLSSIEG